MTIYVDSSALMKRYVEEHDSSAAAALLESDPDLVTSRLTEIEIRRNLARLLTGAVLVRKRRSFRRDLAGLGLVALDAATLADAAEIAERTQCRSLDSIHIAASRVPGPETVLLTFDRRQARAARNIGLEVVGP